MNIIDLIIHERNEQLRREKEWERSRPSIQPHAPDPRRRQEEPAHQAPPQDDRGVVIIDFNL